MKLDLFTMIFEHPSISIVFQLSSQMVFYKWLILQPIELAKLPMPYTRAVNLDTETSIIPRHFCFRHDL